MGLGIKKAFTDDGRTLNQTLGFSLGRVENIVGKGENAGHQHFLLFPTIFSNGYFLGIVKNRDCVVKG